MALTVTAEQIKGYVPDFYLETATDDEALNTGVVNAVVFASIVSSAVIRVKGMLAPGYVVDEASATPAFVQYALELLVVDQVFKRRGTKEHPFEADIEALFERLKAIGSGKERADSSIKNYFGPESQRIQLLFDDAMTRGAY